MFPLVLRLLSREDLSAITSPQLSSPLLYFFFLSHKKRWHEFENLMQSSKCLKFKLSERCKIESPSPLYARADIWQSWRRRYPRLANKCRVRHVPEDNPSLAACPCSCLLSNRTCKYLQTAVRRVTAWYVLILRRFGHRYGNWNQSRINERMLL